MLSKRLNSLDPNHLWVLCIIVKHTRCIKNNLETRLNTDCLGDTVTNKERERERERGGRGVQTVIQLQGSRKHKNLLFTMVLMEVLYSGKYTFQHYCYSVIFAFKSLVNFFISRYWRGLLQNHFQIWFSLGVFLIFLEEMFHFFICKTLFGKFKAQIFSSVKL